jgi:dTMP kinase
MFGTKRRGLLVAFEGPDGSGKTTQRKLLKNWLAGEGKDVIVTKWNSSPLIKPILKARKAERSLTPEQFAELAAADFRHRFDTEIRPALEQGKIVLADRYVFTGIARDVARGLDRDWSRRLYEPILEPDMVFYFSVSPETCASRIASSREPGFYEAGQDVTGMADPFQSYDCFIRKVLREYERLSEHFCFTSIDAEQCIYDQHEFIVAVYHELEASKSLGQAASFPSVHPAVLSDARLLQ